jgi:hypothetical protein
MPKTSSLKKSNRAIEVKNATQGVVERFLKLGPNTKKRNYQPHIKRSRTRSIMAHRLLMKKLLRLKNTGQPGVTLSAAYLEVSDLKAPQNIEHSVVKIIEEKNPFADKNGSPKQGKESEFFDWAENNWNSHLETLSKEEKKKHIDAAISLSEKMNA